MKRSWGEPNVCVLCAADEETINYLFIGCLFRIHIWTRWHYAWECISHNYLLLFGLHWDTYQLMNATWYLGFNSDSCFQGDLNHPIKHSMSALLSFLSGSMSSQADPGIWWGGLWSRHIRERSPTATPSRRRIGDDSDSDDMWPVVLRGLDFLLSGLTRLLLQVQPVFCIK